MKSIMFLISSSLASTTLGSLEAHALYFCYPLSLLFLSYSDILVLPSSLTLSPTTILYITTFCHVGLLLLLAHISLISISRPLLLSSLHILNGLPQDLCKIVFLSFWHQLRCHLPWDDFLGHLGKTVSSFLSYLLLYYPIYYFYNNS